MNEQYIMVIPKEKQQEFLSSLNVEFPERFTLAKCYLSGSYYFFTFNISKDENKEKLAEFQEKFL